MRTSEHSEQVALFECIERYKSRYPDLGLIFAIPNGALRHPVVGAKLKQEGARAGVPDIFVAVPRLRSGIEDMSCGLFIEMKFGSNVCSPKQIEWLGQLRQAGYDTDVCWGWLAAWTKICRYLDIPLEVSA